MVLRIITIFIFKFRSKPKEIEKNLEEREVKEDLQKPKSISPLIIESPKKINEEIKEDLIQKLKENNEKPISFQSDDSLSDMQIDDSESLSDKIFQEKNDIPSLQIIKNNDKTIEKPLSSNLKTPQLPQKQDFESNKSPAELKEIDKQSTAPIETEEKEKRLEPSNNKCFEEKAFENPQEFDLALVQLSKKGIFHENVKFQIEERKSFDDQLSIEPEFHMERLTTTPIQEDISQKTLKERYIDQLLELTRKMQEIQKSAV